MSRTTTTIGPSTSLIPTEENPAPVDAYKQDPALAAAVERATSSNGVENCTPKYESGEQMTDVQGDKMMETLKALNKKECKWEKEANSTVAGGCSVFIGGCAGAANQYVSGKAEGCEQLSIMSNVVNQCTQQLSCMLNEASSSTTVAARIYQSIDADLGDVKDSSFTIKNTSTGEFQTLNLTQSTVQSAIGATITNGLDQAIASLQETKNGTFSDPTSQTIIQSALTNLQQVSSNTTVNKSVAKTSMQLSVEQSIRIKIRSVEGSVFDIQNVNILKAIAENYVYNALDQVLKTEQTAEVKQELTTGQKQENEGTETQAKLPDVPMGMILGGIFGPLLFIIIAFVVAYKFFPGFLPPFLRPKPK